MDVPGEIMKPAPICSTCGRPMSLVIVENSVEGAACHFECFFHVDFHLDETKELPP
jgi:hypothetical protein